MIILIMSAAVFMIIKGLFELIAWLSTDSKDKIYRQYLDKLWDALDKYNFYDLAFLSCQRIIFRLKLSNPKVLIVVALLFVIQFFIDFTAILVSLSIMAKNNVNFDLSDKSVIEIAWILFRELGFTGSQQILWMLFGTSFFSFFTFFFSRHLILVMKSRKKLSQLVLLIGKQLGIVLLAGIVTLTFMLLSVQFYDWGSNTETQQYLLSQTSRMLYSQEQPFPTIILLNTIVSALPTVLFLLIFLFFVILRITPNTVRKSINYLIYRLTTDNKPVMSQIGNFFGGVAGLITAILKLVER